MTENLTDLVGRLVVGSKADGRRVYSKEGKRAVVEACLAGKASVARIALQIGVNANLVRRWIDGYQANGNTVRLRGRTRDAPQTKLLPVAVTPVADDSNRTELVTGCVEVSRSDVTVWVHGRVDVERLSVVLDWLSRRA